MFSGQWAKIGFYQLARHMHRKTIGFPKGRDSLCHAKRMVRRFRPEQFWVSNRGESALLAGESNGDSVPVAVVSKGGSAALAGSIQ